MARLASELTGRGHAAAVFAATRDPTRRQYEVLRDELPLPATAPGRAPVVIPVTRLVQNVPVRALHQAERDAAVEQAMQRAVRDFQPDLVHVHHIQFLSSGLRFPVPWVLTLHDQWLWCAAGGIGLLPDGSLCPGPAPERCAPCAAAWSPRPNAAARATLDLAGRLSPLLPPPLLHRAFRLLPATARRRLQSPIRGAAPEPPEAAARRNAAMADFARAAAARIAPSAHLASLAAALGPVEVLPHGVDRPAVRPRPGQRQGPLLFLGTLAAHKGPDLVVRAWRLAFPAGDPPLALHGPVQDPGLALGHPIGAPLDRAGVQRALADARALVLGSRWPENAPLVVLEARAAGCPVIAPAIGGLPELVEPGRDGWLYPAGDVQALAECLRLVMQQPLADLPRMPPTVAEQVDRLESIYRRVLP